MLIIGNLRFTFHALKRLSLHVRHHCILTRVQSTGLILAFFCIQSVFDVGTRTRLPLQGGVRSLIVNLISLLVYLEATSKAPANSINQLF